jgi:hypothetical protein
MEFDLQEDCIDFDFLDEDLNQLNASTQHDAVIFLIDAQAINFVNENVEESNLAIVANSYANFLKAKIVSSAYDKAGLIFYNAVSLQGQPKELIQLRRRVHIPGPRRDCRQSH